LDVLRLLMAQGCFISCTGVGFWNAIFVAEPRAAILRPTWSQTFSAVEPIKETAPSAPWADVSPSTRPPQSVRNSAVNFTSEGPHWMHLFLFSLWNRKNKF
jgi:hypothetical protein